MSRLPIFVALWLAPAVTGVMAAEGRYIAEVFDETIVEGGVSYRDTTDVEARPISLQLDVYAPCGDDCRDRPAVILLHGGSFLPRFNRQQPHLVELAEALARHGYVVVTPDYRVRDRPLDDPMGTLRDAVDDCRDALDWVRAHAAEYGIDPARIAIVGSSAGAIIGVSLVGLENSAARRFGGPGLFAFVNLWGSPVHAYRLCNFDDRYAPTLIVHGTADAIVPFANSEQLAADLRAAKVDVELLALPEAPHTPRDHSAEIIGRVVTFLADRFPDQHR
jgi:acetyl esterase/lipase